MPLRLQIQVLQHGMEQLGLVVHLQLTKAAIINGTYVTATNGNFQLL